MRAWNSVLPRSMLSYLNADAMFALELHCLYCIILYIKLRHYYRNTKDIFCKTVLKSRKSITERGLKLIIAEPHYKYKIYAQSSKL
jgi:hypothetical protein